MAKQARRRRNAENLAARLVEQVGRIGWIIVVDSNNWYGPFADRETALGRLGRRDSWGDTIRGVVVCAEAS